MVNLEPSPRSERLPHDDAIAGVVVHTARTAATLQNPMLNAHGQTPFKVVTSNLHGVL